MPGPLRVIDIVDLEETIQRIVSDILERPTFTVVNAQLAVRDQAIAQRALASDIDTEFAARDIAIAARALAVDLQAGLSVRPTITTVNAELAARDVAISARALVSELSAAVTDLTTAINARALAADVTSGFAARPPMIVRQTTQDYVRDVTALADIPELGFAAEANRRYGFILLALYQSAAVGTGVSLSMNGPNPPAGKVPAWDSGIQVTGGPSTSSVQHKAQTAANALHTTASVDVANTPRIGRFMGSWPVGGTGGVVTPRFASEVAGSQVRVLEGSWLLAW